MEELNEADIAHGTRAREQTLRRERAWVARVRSVLLKYTRRFFGKIRQFRNRALHAIRHLILRDARGDFGVAELFEAELVDLAQVFDEPPACRVIDALWIG